MKLFPRPLTWLQGWAESSQQVARRNAMVASNALAQRRAELLDVEEHLLALAARTQVAIVPVDPPAVAHG